jgi:hypothetical protein
VYPPLFFRNAFCRPGNWIARGVTAASYLFDFPRPAGAVIDQDNFPRWYRPARRLLFEDLGRADAVSGQKYSESYRSNGENPHVSAQLAKLPTAWCFVLANQATSKINAADATGLKGATPEIKRDQPA